MLQRYCVTLLTSHTETDEHIRVQECPRNIFVTKCRVTQGPPTPGKRQIVDTAKNEHTSCLEPFCAISYTK